MIASPKTLLVVRDLIYRQRQLAQEKSVRLQRGRLVCVRLMELTTTVVPL